MRKGVPISPGIAVAHAHRLDEILVRREVNHLQTGDLVGEINRFLEACAAAAREIEAVAQRVHEQVGEPEAAIFQAHQLLLQDPMLLAKVQTSIIQRRVDAVTALHDVLDEYSQLVEQVQDDALKRRLSDLRDVLGRVMTHLTAPEQVHPAEQPKESVIVVAPEILPSQAMMLNHLKVAGIVTQAGGPTSHAAILARALGIPAVSGLQGIMEEVHSGDLLIVDGREGLVHINPGPEVEAAYRKLQREYVHMRDRMIGNRDEEPITNDGIAVELLANVNGPEDAMLAAKTGASGVGLYRTEFLFLRHPSVPDEEEQYEVYRQVIEATPNQRVTIRTLDLGGDKSVPYLGGVRETNPFMGWRSIRLVSSHPEFFQTQLRAIFRAATAGEVNLLFPMITTPEELIELKQLVEEAKSTLRRRKAKFAKNVPLGVMIEVPAAALMIHTLLREIDFVSIGSNDLIQYVMAADRDNPKVAHLCEPFQPAIMKILSRIIRTCNQYNKPVTLCGEMAGRPRCFLPLFGMGLRRLSMSPAFVPTVKELVLATDLTRAQKIARRVLSMRRVDQVRKYLTRSTRIVCPNVAQLDTSE